MLEIKSCAAKTSITKRIDHVEFMVACLTSSDMIVFTEAPEKRKTVVTLSVAAEPKIPYE